MQLNNKKWLYTVAVSSLMLIGDGLWHSNNIVNADSGDRSSSSATTKSPKFTKSKSMTKSKKSSDRNSKSKMTKFNASIHNLPNSTKGVISKVKYEKNLVNELYINLTISDATLNKVYDKELKRICFNMYRKVKDAAQKAGLRISYLTIVDEQGDLLYVCQNSALSYYGMGEDVNA